jgi:hypothetical protein
MPETGDEIRHGFGERKMDCDDPPKIISTQVQQFPNIAHRIGPLSRSRAQERREVILDLGEKCGPLARREISVNLAQASATASRDS